MTTKKAATNGAKATKKATSRTKTKPKKAKKELTADEALLIAWQDTYAKRHKRVA
ncbi:MAG: hypothetical protein KF868_19135 [Acidobacteria bacterium]|nr:hypothetical protein [Acidobacteriota bacterium]